ncbi:MAG: hypothetical protein WDN44_13830 [Sphingomonas sp.]
MSPAAQTLLSLGGPRNTEHPLVGKELIALGIALFGDNPFGWRLGPQPVRHPPPRSASSRSCGCCSGGCGRR